MIGCPILMFDPILLGLEGKSQQLLRAIEFLILVLVLAFEKA